ncbi:MAG: CBS domain-containing protein [Myxococcota bacterium]
MQIQRIMTTDVKTCAPHDDLTVAAHLMWENDCGCLPVLDQDRKIRGIITDRDICMAAYTQGQRLRDIQVQNAMSREVFFCQPDQELEHVEQLMQHRQIRRVPVVNEENILVGVLSINDIARHSNGNSNGKRHGSKAGVSAKEVTETLAAICEPRSHRPRLAVS